MRRFGSIALACMVALWLAATSCKSSGNGGKGPMPRATACDEARDHVEALYREHLAGATAGDAARARLDEQIADDVDMVLTDCRGDPARFAPCLRAAVSAPQMERDCLVPLDDEGKVEGEAFGPARGAP